MRTQVFGPRGAGYTTARHAAMALWIGAVIVSLAGSVFGQGVQRAPAPQVAEVVDEAPDEVTYSPRTGRRAV